MKTIKGFFEKYRFLSNFWPAKVSFEGMEFESIEHAYQAAKTLDLEIRTQFQGIKANEAKNLAKKFKTSWKDKMREDWDDVKLQIMEDLVRQKFTTHLDLKQQLIDTGGCYLEESNTWHDVWWGVCKGKGENHLGKILMKIREELKPNSN